MSRRRCWGTLEMQAGLQSEETLGPEVCMRGPPEAVGMWAWALSLSEGANRRGGLSLEKQQRLMTN